MTELKEFLEEVKNREEAIGIIPGISKQIENEIEFVANEENISFEEAAELLLRIGAHNYCKMCKK